MINGNKTFSVLIILILSVSMLTYAESASAQTSNIQPLSNPVIIITPTPSPTPMPTPTATPTRNIAIDYDKVSRTTEGDNTTLILNVTEKYNFGNPAIFYFQDFILTILTNVTHGLPPEVFQEESRYVKPLETGNITIGVTDKEASFQLTYVFPTIQTTFYGQQKNFTDYELTYRGSMEYVNPPSSLSPNSTFTSAPTSIVSTPNPTSGNQQLTNIALIVAVVIIALLAAALVLRNKGVKA